MLAYIYMLKCGRAEATRLEGASAVTHVRDDDTIEVAGVPIRFAELDCTERGTPAGERARQAMSRLAAGQRLQCELTGRRSYDRMIGEYDVSDGRSLSEIMTRGGYCRRWRPLARCQLATDTGRN